MLFELTVVLQAFKFPELLIDHLVTAIFVSDRLHSNDFIAIEYTIGIQREFNLKTIRRRQHIVYQLTLRIMSVALSPSSSSNTSRRARPIPCSPVTVPSISMARLCRSRIIFSAATLSFSLYRIPVWKFPSSCKPIAVDHNAEKVGSYHLQHDRVLIPIGLPCVPYP